MLLTLVSGQTLKRSPRIYRTPKCSFFGCLRTTISNLDYFRPLLKGHPVRISVDPDDEEEIEKKLVPNDCNKNALHTRTQSSCFSSTSESVNWLSMRSKYKSRSSSSSSSAGKPLAN